MTHSQRQRVDKVMRSGKIIALLNQRDCPELTGRIYINSESRGYKTDFQVKHFFYIIAFENGQPINISGITKDSRRKDILNHFKKQDIDHKILDEKYWNEWLS